MAPDKGKSAGSMPLLGAEEEWELLLKIRTGDMNARKRVILANSGLVFKWAHHYKYFGVPLEDLIQEGQLGLIHAIDRFIPTGEARLSTYATWWIRHYIRRAIANQSCPFHVPTPILASICRLRNLSEQLKAQLNREPYFEELAKEMGCSVTHVQTLKQANASTMALHECYGGDGVNEGTSIGERIADDSQPTPLEYLVRNTLASDIEQWFLLLSEREVKILRMRYGLGGQMPLTFEEIGKNLSLNRERVRQIAQSALKKIRKVF
ncbi:MAG: sigma-70 family RNA polymerase sigma factor [Puniceicoccales bacterium]|jgi:RNA polymerase primary sigma factor|nr:sigma-70 family RNA polymerase sigma factor [Puniceicoccales bacterium]